MRGIEGKIEAIQLLPREQGARSSASAWACSAPSSSSRATSAAWRAPTRWEFDEETPYPVIDLLPEQKDVERHGRHHAAGRREAVLPGAREPRARRLRRRTWSTSVTATASRSTTSCGRSSRPPAWSISGTTPDGRLVEIVELPDHPWFVASQFHPEFKSRPTRPAPLFRDFVGAAARLRASATAPDG